MPIQVLMPALSPTMTEGNLAKWLKKEGDAVKAGDVLAEIETDKATMEVEAVDEGTLGQILVPAGTQGVKVNAPIAVLLGEGEKPGAAKGPAPAPKGAAAPPPAAAAPAAAPAQKRNGHAAPATGDGGRLVASPLARRMAEQAGIDLARIAGSGPGGRIVKADIEAAIAGGGTKPAGLPALRPATPAPVAAAAPVLAPGAVSKSQVQLMAGGIPFKEVPLTGMRKVIARRLTESKQQVPHFYVAVDCQLDALLEMRKQLNERAPDSKLSVNDFVIKAAALALRKVPAANASYSDECLMLWEQVDISVAVAIPGGLITPIIKRADQKGLATISAEMKDLAQRAKEGKLKPEEFQGGTFSISNLGMFGVRHFEAVINPPQGAILAVGAGEPRPVVKNGALAVATVMTCTISCDHRVVDGAVGAEYMQAFKRIVEDPLAMML